MFSLFRNLIYSHKLFLFSYQWIYISYFCMYTLTIFVFYICITFISFYCISPLIKFFFDIAILTIFYFFYYFLSLFTDFICFNDKPYASFQPLRDTGQQHFYLLFYFLSTAQLIRQINKSNRQPKSFFLQNLPQRTLILPVSLTYLTFYPITLYRPLKPLFGDTDKDRHRHFLLLHRHIHRTQRKDGKRT